MKGKLSAKALILKAGQKEVNDELGSLGRSMHHHTPDALKIDVGSVTTREELHSLVAGAFGFPDYYGQNWDAFDECIRDVELPQRIEITGLEALRVRLPREAELFQRCIADFVEERHHDITLRTA